MNKLALFCFFACLLVGCKSPSSDGPSYPTQYATLDPAGKEFWRRMHYPYYASRERRQRIKRGWEKIRGEMTETQVLAILGPPDVKGYVAGYPPKIPPTEDWDYFYRLKRPLGPHYRGDIFTLTMSEANPRTVQIISPVDINLRTE